jgi:hypothetical protein
LTRLLTATALGCATAFLLYLAAASLDWRMVHDPPLNMYQGFLIDRLGLVPYRDFWDNNPPGSQLFHAFVGRAFGYGDRAVRRADLLLLAATAAATFLALRPIGARAAWCAGVLWGLVYLGTGPNFQRDDFVILPLSLALALVSGAPRWPLPLRALGLGLLFGGAATIKPPALIALPVLAYPLAHDAGSPRRVAAALLFIATGVALPLLAVVVYLWRHDALAPFLEMARGYWPLYTRLSGGLGTIQSPAFNLYSGYRVFGRLQWWLVPAAVGVVVAFFATRSSQDQRRRLWVLLALAVALLAYVGVQGKFFPYHWHPFLYCLLLLASLSLAELDGRVPPLLRPLPLVLLVAFLVNQLPIARDFREQLQGRLPTTPKDGRPDEIAAFLRGNLAPGDTVQPLDWTGGVVHAMLIAEARPATPYLYDFPFYHHVSAPYTSELRGRFLEALREARPRYVIEVPGEDKPWVKGRDTTRDFNKLRRFLESNYVEAGVRNGYVVYTRRD